MMIDWLEDANTADMGKGIECDYKDIQPFRCNVQLLTPEDFSGGESPSPSSGRREQRSLPDHSPASESPDGPAFTLHDLALMHHWTLATCRTIGALDNENYHSIWQIQVSELAQAYPFLMHALLSTTSMHLAITETSRPSATYIDSSQNHYTASLNLFKQDVTQVNNSSTPRLGEAVWCFSVLIMHVSFAMGRLGTSLGQHAIGTFADVLHAFRSAFSVLIPLHTSLQNSEIAGLLEHTRHRRTHPLPPEVDASLHNLQSTMDSQRGAFSLQELTLLEKALSSTRHFFTLVSPHPSTWSHILQWPFSLDPSFFQLLQNRNPVALALLAHWCVPIHYAPERWSVGDWAVVVVRDMEMELVGSEWIHAIQWPLGEIVGV